MKSILTFSILTFFLLLSSSNPLFAQTYLFNTDNSSIPDNGCGTSELIAEVEVTNYGRMDSASGRLPFLRINITHSYVSDVQIRLESPEGTTIVLMPGGYGGSGQNLGITKFANFVDTPISDGLPPFNDWYMPEESFTAFDGEVADGIWKLIICDGAAQDIGNFNSATMEFNVKEFGSDQILFVPVEFGTVPNLGLPGGAIAATNGTITFESGVLGEENGALSFDGAAHGEFSSDFNPTTGFSFAAWVKPSADASGSVDYALVKGDPSTSSFYGIGITAFTPVLQVGTGSGGTIVTISGGASPAGKWTHIAGTWKKDGMARLYVNGIEVASQAAQTIILPNLNNTHVSIGGDADGGYLYDGALDELRGYNYEISPTEVRAIAEADNSYCYSGLPLPVNGTSCTVGAIGHNYASSMSNQQAATCPGLVNGGDLWYKVIVPASGNLAIETSEFAGSVIDDTVLEVYTGSCGSLTQVGCNDDIATGSNTFSKVELDGFTPGEELLVRVWEYNNNTSGFLSLCAYETFNVDVEDVLAAESTFDVFPNPTDGLITINLETEIVASGLLTITDINGKLMLQEDIENRTINSKQMDLSSYSSGVYVVHVSLGSHQFSKKIIVQ